MRAAAAILTAAFLLLVAATSADAYYGNGKTDDGAEIVADYGRLEQGDDATTYAAVSADGRYVVIQTRARNFFADDDPDPDGAYRAGGLFRYEIATQKLVKVAGGDLFAEGSGEFLRRGASNPSVSADGRYVAFATAEPLVAADHNDNVDVYVRDMDVPESAADAFDLVSARDGGDIPASYGPPLVPSPGSNPGSDLTRGVSISENGRYVVFRTEVASDLPDRGSVDTDAGQLFVRDRNTDETTLVTRTDPGGQPAGGALGASISGDGTTVAWTGTNAAAQTRFLNGEPLGDGLNFYLWRRVADGPSAPTRRITGVSDPDDPACPPGQQTTFDAVSQGPCFGPITDQEGTRSSIIAQVPVMSRDGYTVAYLTGAGPRPLAFTGPGLDLFVTDMHPGLTRKAATTELTRASATTDPATSAPIGSLAMSPDGEHLVIATSRTVFSLPALAPVAASRTVAGIRELYAIDLGKDTIDRVVRSYSGEDANSDAQNGATISNGGERVAFTSFAGNLFYGDANQRSDAFVATLQPDPDVDPPPECPPECPPPPPTEEDDRIVVKQTVGSKGRTLLRIRLPGAGGIKVVARGKAGKPRSTRSLATGTARAQEKAWVEVPLRIVKRYRAELADRGKIKARAKLDFVYSVGGRRIGDAVPVVFRQKAAKSSGRGR